MKTMKVLVLVDWPEFQALKREEHNFTMTEYYEIVIYHGKTDWSGVCMSASFC